MGRNPIPPYRPPSAEEHVRRCYITGKIDFEAMERALHEIIVEGRAGVPAYVPPRDPGVEIGRSLRTHERAWLT